MVSNGMTIHFFTTTFMTSVGRTLSNKTPRDKKFNLNLRLLL